MARRRKRWWANRYVAHFGNIEAYVEFHRTTAGETGWEWEVDDEDPDQPRECGRAKTLRAAKAQAERAAKRHRG